MGRRRLGSFRGIKRHPAVSSGLLTTGESRDCLRSVLDCQYWILGFQTRARTEDSDSYREKLRLL